METKAPPAIEKTSTLDTKISSLKEIFLTSDLPEDKYHLLMDLGKKLPPLDSKYKTEETLVRGCQSILYLHAELRNGLLFFSAATDALISAGLAALLIKAYNGESIETILTKPPHFLQTLGIHSSLSPNRSNGILHIYLKMKQLAITHI